MVKLKMYTWSLNVYMVINNVIICITFSQYRILLVYSFGGLLFDV